MPADTVFGAAFSAAHGRRSCAKLCMWHCQLRQAVAVCQQRIRGGLKNPLVWLWNVRCFHSRTPVKAMTKKYCRLEICIAISQEASEVLYIVTSSAWITAATSSDAVRNP